MTNEQEVIERLKYDISAGEYSITKTELLETALKMLKEKDKQIDFYKKGLEKEIDSNRENIMEIIKKDKIIDLMAEEINETNRGYNDYCQFKIVCDRNCKGCIKQYFEKKVKE